MAKRRKELAKKRLHKNIWRIYWYDKRKLFEISLGSNLEEDEVETIRIKTDLFLRGASEAPEEIESSKSFKSFLDFRSGAPKASLSRNGIFEKYFNHIKPDVSEKWFYESKRVLNNFNKKFPEIFKINKLDASSFIDKLAAKRTPSTVNHHLKILRKFYNWLVEYAGLEENPFAKLKAPRDVRNNIDIEYATKEERTKILEIADMHEQGLALWLAHYCGLRRGEIYSIKKEHVNINAETIIILGKGGKIRTVSMPDIIVEKVKSQLAKNLKSDFLLPYESSHSASARALVKFINRTIDGLKMKKKEKERLKAVSGFQVGRRSFCTHMIQAGVPIEIVTYIAGHAPEVARRHYMRFTPKDKKDKRIELIN